MDASLLFPAVFRVLTATISEQIVYLELIFTSSIGYCPHCHTPSKRIYSCYQRRLKDLPMNGKPVLISLYIHKFFCEQADCPRKIFSQQVQSGLKPYARRLERVDQQLQPLAFVVGSKPGARVCQLIGLPLSASTLLRLIRKTPLPRVETPAVLGVDDFAFRKGITYGTILVDLDKRKPIDLLSDRESKTLENWLIAHPGVKIVARDRSQVYANAITTVCPDAIQIADRWHLLKNLSENVVKFLDSHATSVRQIAGEVAAEKGEEIKRNAPQSLSPAPAIYIGDTGPLLKESADLKGITPSSVLEKIPTEKRYATYCQVKQLQSQGHDQRVISLHLKISRNTISKYFRQPAFVPKHTVKRANLIDYEPYLRQCWQQGNTCGRKLFGEIQDIGYKGCYSILADFLTAFPKARYSDPLSSLPVVARPISYSSRRLSIALCLQEAEWKEKEKPLLKKLLKKVPLLDQVRKLSLEFKTMLMLKQADKLQNWYQRAGELASFKRFVWGIKQDFDAVYQAMSSSWSSGQVEGQVNRLKTIKRQMYGRASFDLLRIRVLAQIGLIT
jgi:transposase